jgi:Mce-associated membrane protein
MTNTSVIDDDKVDETDMTDGTAETDKADMADKAVDDAAPSQSIMQRLRSAGPWLWVAVVLAAMLLGGGVFGYMKYQQLNGQLTEMHRAQADRAAAAQLAKDYALKSLTYTFEDPDAFFRSVEDGVSQQLKDKYVNAGELLKAVMLDAQVTSTGEVLATDPVAAPDGSYQVVVSAHQTTRNMQNPTPKVSIILLQVTVNKAGNGWQVTDIGPKTGDHPPVEQQLPAPQLPPAPAAPAPKR